MVFPSQSELRVQSEKVRLKGPRGRTIVHEMRRIDWRLQFELKHLLLYSVPLSVFSLVSTCGHQIENILAGKM